MKTKINLANLFDEEPAQWGYRGDPYLWRELRTYFESVEIPESSEAFKALMAAAFEAATHTTFESESIHVKQFDNGDMSRGMISTVYWRETAIPLLLSRFEELRK